MPDMGPRDWSPRNTVWIVIMDADGNFDVEVFKSELSAYKFTVKHIMDHQLEGMEKEDSRNFKAAVKKGHLDEAMEVYDYVMGEYGADAKLTFYSIVKKEIVGK